jgi:hypothetical protein
MISRRELLATSVAGGLVSNAEPAEAHEAAQQQEIAGHLRTIALNIADLDRTMGGAWLSNRVVFGLADKVRAQYETFFRTHQKFPDFLEVGLSVFLDVYDWHIKNRQQLLISRGAEGRYQMQFMFTTLILRGEHDGGYIGIPYDRP